MKWWGVVKMFSLFKKRDPVCGMKEENNEGIKTEGEWFCSKACLEKYKGLKKNSEKHDCCCSKREE